MRCIALAHLHPNWAAANDQQPLWKMQPLATKLHQVAKVRLC